MLKLQSLQSQLDSLRTAFETAINEGKSTEEIKDMFMHIKNVERAIYERKMMLKREGRFEQN